MIKHDCKLFNKHSGREIFKFKAIRIKQADIKELINEAILQVGESLGGGGVFKLM